MTVMSSYHETGSLTFGMGNLSVFTFSESEFITSGYVCCIGGMTVADWTATGDEARPYIFIHERVWDTEKKDTVTLDDKWCGAMTETNLLELAGHLNRCGWLSADQFMADIIANGVDLKVNRPRTAIFDNIDSSWNVLWGSFDRTGLQNTWLRQADEQLRSGNYVGWFQVEWARLAM